MKLVRTLIVVAALLAAVGFVRAESPAPIDLRAAPAAQPLYGIRGVWLSRFDAVQLRPTGKRMLLETSISDWAFSPDRRRLVLGSNDRGRLTFLATPGLRRLGTVEPLVAASHLFWIGNRILSVGPLYDSVFVGVVDPARRRIAATKWIEGQLVRAAQTPTQALLLLGTENVGPPTLAVVDALGRVRKVELRAIRAGWEEFDEEATTHVFRFAQPGLAVSPDGSRALVIGSGVPVAEIDLRTLEVTYHELSQHISLLGRVRDWLEPRAHAKGPFEGPTRAATWLDDNTVAVYGADDRGYFDTAGQPQHRQMPAGVKLIDVRSWSVRTLDADATALTTGGGLLLAWGSTYDAASDRSTGIGLRGYGPTGERRYQAFGNAALWDIRVVGNRGIVALAGRYAVVDLRSGRVLRQVNGSPPHLLVD